MIAVGRRYTKTFAEEPFDEELRPWIDPEIVRGACWDGPNPAPMPLLRIDLRRIEFGG